MDDRRFDPVRAPFLCECGRSLCEERVVLLLSEYDEIAEAHPRWRLGTTTGSQKS